MKALVYFVVGVLLFVTIQIGIAMLSPCSVWSIDQESCDSNMIQSDN